MDDSPSRWRRTYVWRAGSAITIWRPCRTCIDSGNAGFASQGRDDRAKARNIDWCVLESDDLKNRLLYYMAPISTAAYIRLVGILSYNRIAANPKLAQLRKDKTLVSIADPEVNAKRHHRRFENGKSLHDYVPMYWTTHTPMQRFLKEHRILRQPELVFFVCHALRISRLPGVISSDGNAASERTKFFGGISAFDHLDDCALRRINHRSQESKRKKMAEVLIPDFVGQSLILSAIVKDEDAKAELIQRTTDAAWSLGSCKKNDMPRITVHPDLFFREYKRVVF